MTIRFRDRDVRAAVHAAVAEEHRDTPDTMILDEFGLHHGSARIDIIAINGVMHGYEIKSEADTLVRLAQQTTIYSQILDFVTLVTGDRHLEKIRAVLPSWWGITLATVQTEEFMLTSERKASENPNVEPEKVASLLWREEAATILELLGAPKNLLRRPRAILYAALVSEFDLESLKKQVRQTLKARQSLRERQQHVPNDG